MTRGRVASFTLLLALMYRLGIVDRSCVYMQKEGSAQGGRLKGLHLQDLQKRVQDQAAWALAKVQGSPVLECFVAAV